MSISYVSDIVHNDVEDVTEEEFNIALGQAVQKHERIILREGDMNGKRMTSEYIANLVIEKINENRIANFFSNKNRVCC